jgi:hypothetical protein
MKNNTKGIVSETIVTLGFIVIAVLLLNPFHFWMPDMMVISMLAAALVLFGVFASFILREKSVDERDNQHRTLAGRNAFLAGSATLLLGIIVQGYSHAVDSWLVIALIVMVVTKIGTRMWSDRNL